MPGSRSISERQGLRQPAKRQYERGKLMSERNDSFFDSPVSSGRFSRRAFGRLLALATAGATMPFYNEGALAHAQLSKVGPLPPGAVKINANENPLGPCAEALEAISKIKKDGGRYLYEETDVFIETLAAQEGLNPSYVKAFAGSSAPLHWAVIAFTSPSRSFVTADPGYEAGARAASFIGAKVVKVPLTKDLAHDVRAMVKADPNAGLIYLCSPNNPTGTVTSHADIEYALEHKPKGAIVLLDEAYIHFTDERPATDLVKKEKDLIILRTFSKLYGMAGLRAGCAIGRPDLLRRIDNYGAGALPVTAMVAATASMKVKDLVPERRRLNRETREDLFAFLKKNGFSFKPSESNCFMLEANGPARELINSMRREQIYIGRIWPVWPNYARITVGTPEEMEKFKKALLKLRA